MIYATTPRPRRSVLWLSFHPTGVRIPRAWRERGPATGEHRNRTKTCAFLAHLYHTGPIGNSVRNTAPYILEDNFTFHNYTGICATILAPHMPTRDNATSCSVIPCSPRRSQWRPLLHPDRLSNVTRRTRLLCCLTAGVYCGQAFDPTPRYSTSGWPPVTSNPRSDCTGRARKGSVPCSGNHSKDDLKESLVSSMSICTISLQLASPHPVIASAPLSHPFGPSYPDLLPFHPRRGRGRRRPQHHRQRRNGRPEPRRCTNKERQAEAAGRAQNSGRAGGRAVKRRL